MRSPRPCPSSGHATADRAGPCGPWLLRALLGVWTVLAVLAAGCSTAPARWVRPPPAVAHAPRADGPFADIEAAVATGRDGRTSGFRLLESNADGLKWRLVLIDNARYTIDLQYYVWFGDASGQLLMARTIAAADRGVKVRVLFDDLNTMLRSMTDPELRDAMLARIDRHPNIEIRVFNAWRERGWLGRVGEALTDFTRLNRRMHNKQMIVDNRVAIVGGRNVGDEYLGLNEEFNFHDLDVLGVGPVARQASAVFDRYWNSEWVRPIPRAADANPAPIRPEMLELPPAAASNPAMRQLLAGRHSWQADLAALPQVLLPGTSVVYADPPSRAEKSRNHMIEAYRALAQSAQRDLLVSNAYIIPDAVFIDDLRGLTGRGVAVRILTNSLASHDVPAVNSHYERWRHDLIATGAGLHEFRADAAIRNALIDTPPVRSGFAGLHIKAMVVDRQRSFIGSMNLDPRSEIFNAEMGVVIDSPPLAEQLARAMERDMGGDNSWQVVRGEDGELRWRSTAGELNRQPARDFGQRLQNLFFKLLPAAYY